jgi:hypothetical protein
MMVRRQLRLTPNFLVQRRSHAPLQQDRCDNAAGEDEEQRCYPDLIREIPSRIPKDTSVNARGDHNQSNTHDGHHADTDTDCLPAFEPSESCTKGASQKIPKHSKDNECNTE